MRGYVEEGRKERGGGREGGRGVLLPRVELSVTFEALEEVVVWLWLILCGHPCTAVSPEEGENEYRKGGREGGREKVCVCALQSRYHIPTPLFFNRL